MKNIATPQPFDDFLRRAFFYNSYRTLFRNFDKYLIHVVLVLVTTTEVFSIKPYEALRGITKTREILATIIKYWLLVAWSLWDLRKIIKFNSCGSNDLFELEMSRVVLGIFMAAMHRRILKELTQVKKRTNTRRKRPKETKLQGNHL